MRARSHDVMGIFLFVLFAFLGLHERFNASRLYCIGTGAEFNIHCSDPFRIQKQNQGGLRE
jgi:hypothetical protein